MVSQEETVWQMYATVNTDTLKPQEATEREREERERELYNKCLDSKPVKCWTTTELKIFKK